MNPRATPITSSRVSRRAFTLALAGVAASGALAACSKGGDGDGASGSGGAGAGSGTLTVSTSFIVQSMDPARNVTPTMTIATRGMYDTLLRGKGGGDPAPVPSLAEKVEAAPDAKKFTFTLRKDVVFADGAKLTSADVLFSFKRLAALKLGSSYLVDGMTFSAPDESTFVIETAAPNPAVPVIVTTAGCAILNSALVKKNGGTDADDAATTDKADTWFNSNSAGSGPYVLDSYRTNDSFVLTRNAKYWGETKPKFDRIVIRNQDAAAQLLSVQRGTDEIAIDLSATQSASLTSNKAVTVKTDPSSSLFRVQLNMDPAASAASSNPHIQEAVRYGVNYQALVQLAGPGAVQAPGLLPTTMPGSLPPDETIAQDIDRAKAAIAASGIASPALKLTYPSDIDVNGIKFATFAQRIEADLNAIGFALTLEAVPVSNYLTAWRKGDMEMTLTYSYPDFMDPTSALSYLPGGSDGVRAGWKKGDDPELEALGATMASTVDDAERASLAQQIQRTLNEAGPYVPLLQTAQTIVSTSGLSGVVLDPGWTLDVAAVS